MVSVLLVAGAALLGNSLARPGGGPVVPAGISAAALARSHVVLEPAAAGPLCGFHDWTVERGAPVPVGPCPISRSDAIRAATAQPKTPICPPGLMCAQLRATGAVSEGGSAMLIAPHTDSVVDARLVNAIAPSIVGPGSSGRLAWAVSVSRRFQFGARAVPPPAVPYLTLVDASSGTLLLSIPGR